MKDRKLPYKHLVLSSSKAFSQHRCEPISIGISLETDPATYAWDNRYRGRFCLFQYTLSGEGRLRVGEERPIPLPVGRAFLVLSPSDTHYWLPKNGQWEFIYVVFVGDMARHHVTALIDQYGHVLDMPLTAPPIETLFRAYRTAMSGPAPDKHIRSSLLYQFLMELYRQGGKPSGELPESIGRAIRKVRAEYSNPQIGVDTLARAARLSRYHFSRLFRKHTGLSPNAYLTRVRIHEATDLLVSTNLPAKQIATMTGFNDYAYFCHVFRRSTGTTPGSVRKDPSTAAALL